MYLQCSEAVQLTNDFIRCLQIQPNKFPGDFQDTFNKVPAGFFIDRALLQHGIQTNALSVMYNTMNKTAQKMVK